MDRHPKPHIASEPSDYHQVLFQDAPVATLVLTLEGKIKHANTAAQTLFDYSETEFQEYTLNDLIVENLIPAAQNTWGHLLQNKHDEGFFIFQGKDKPSIYASYAAIISTQTNVCIFTIDNLKHVDSEKHFYNLFEHTPVALLETDHSKIIAYLQQNKNKFWNNPQAYFPKNSDECRDVLNLRIIKKANKTALELFKVQDIKSLHKTLSNTYVKTDLSNIYRMLADIVTEKIIPNYELQIIDALGKTHTANVHFSNDHLNSSHTFVAFFDISEIKETQETLETLETNVALRTQELEQANLELHAEITSRKKMAKDLHHSEMRYQQLNAIYPIGIFHADLQGNITYNNDKACEIQGLSKKVIHYNWMENLHPKDHKHVTNSWGTAIKYGMPLNLDYRFLIGEKITWVNMKSVPEYDDAEKVVGYVGIFVDITKQREVEAQVQESQIEIAHFSRLNSMGEVASGIAHELNQPLTAIINYSSGCKRRLQDFKQTIPKEIFAAIEQTIAQAQRAGKIIHHLKDFLRKGELSKKSFDLNAAIKDVLSFINRLSIQNNVKIKLKLDSTLPSIYADKIHIEQVILNIITNAIEAFIETHSSKREITIYTETPQTNQVKITITDTGPGINPQFIDNIFNPFVTTKEQGMGIGLSLCYNIITKHDGKIEVTSILGEGASFSILLPIKYHR